MNDKRKIEINIVEVKIYKMLIQINSNVRTGKVIKETVIAAEGSTTIDTNTQSGAYVVSVAVETDVVNTTVMLQ